MRKSGKKKQPDAIDEVEELLKVTEDDLLLRLTVNSHINSKPTFHFAPESSHSNAIDPDLDRRFQALRSKSKPNPNPKSEIIHEDVDNLLARFDALKGRNATSGLNSVTADINIVDAEEEEEDEVQKIINWAKDAARLDPSPSSDEDDDDDDDDQIQGTSKKTQKG